MSVQSELRGAQEVLDKLERLGKPSKAKSIARKSLRQAANIMRDEARLKAKAIDDPQSSEKIWKNIVVQGGKSRRRDEVKIRIGVKGGASFTNPNPPRESGGDTRHWRLIEFGSVNNPAVPFMRSAMSSKIEQSTTKFVGTFNTELDKELGP